MKKRSGNGKEANKSKKVYFIHLTVRLSMEQGKSKGFRASEGWNLFGVRNILPAFTDSTLVEYNIQLKT